MRLTLTGLSSQYIHMPLAPLCLQKAVEERLPSIGVTVCETNVNEPVEELLRRLMDTRPDVAGFSMYIWNREMTGRIVRRMKALAPEIVVVVGGPEATYSVEETFAEMPIDYLLRGAGEESLPRLLQALMEHTPMMDVPGLCWREETRIHQGEIAPAPPPRDDLYDDRWKAVLNGRMAYVETSRGCPFSCAFCLSGQKERVRFMDREKALRLLIRVGQSGADTVKLIDRTFNCDRERTAYLLGGLIEARRRGEIGRVCYHLEVAADLFDDETLALLSTAPPGLFQMEAGLQSFHPETLDACNRRTDMARLTDRLRRILLPGNVHLHIDLIAGLPEEDFTTFGRSFDQAFAIHPHQLQLGFLKLIHGSRLRESKWGQRYAPDPPYEILSTPWMTYEELSRLHACAEAVERLHNSGRYADTLSLALKATEERPFNLFLRLGKAMQAQPGGWSQDALCRLVYNELLGLGVPDDALRESLMIDRLSTDNTGHLPPFLQGDVTALRRAVRRYREAHPEVPYPRCALLPDGSLLVAAWTDKHPVTQRGEVFRVQP